LQDVPYLGDDEAVAEYPADRVRLVNGLGGVGDTKPRARLFSAFKERGYQFLTVTHPSSVIAPDVRLEEGAQVLAGAVIMPGCTIGRNAIVNTRASIDHDCNIGAHVHVCPGATLSGDVTVEAEAHIGTGASVIQGVTIGRNAVVGAGAVVVCAVPGGVTVIGVPARPRGPGA
jgi:UDP-perosamine 4-acetyltransferase